VVVVSVCVRAECTCRISEVIVCVVIVSGGVAFVHFVCL